MAKKDWEINNTVKQILTKNWLDILQIKINTIKDSVYIGGKLIFRGGKVDNSSDISVIEHMKKVDRDLKREIKEIKHIKWNLKDWEVRHNRWQRKTMKEKQVDKHK